MKIEIIMSANDFPNAARLLHNGCLMASYIVSFIGGVGDYIFDFASSLGQSLYTLCGVVYHSGVQDKSIVDDVLNIQKKNFILFSVLSNIAIKMTSQRKCIDTQYMDGFAWSMADVLEISKEIYSFPKGTINTKRVYVPNYLDMGNNEKKEVDAFFKRGPVSFDKILDTDTFSMYLNSSGDESVVVLDDKYFRGKYWGRCRLSNLRDMYDRYCDLDVFELANCSNEFELNADVLCTYLDRSTLERMEQTEQTKSL